MEDIPHKAIISILKNEISKAMDGCEIPTDGGTEPLAVVKPPPPYKWACDAELHSKYMLKRDELAADNRSYLLDHPDLRALLSDFIQAALLRKPAHLIPFAASYFESFLKFHPEDESSTSSSSSSSSSLSLGMGEEEWGGEWSGEGDGAALDSYRFYSTRPTRSLDGLEKVSSEEIRKDEEEPITPLNSENVDVAIEDNTSITIEDNTSITIEDNAKDEEPKEDSSKEELVSIPSAEDEE